MHFAPFPTTPPTLPIPPIPTTARKAILRTDFSLGDDANGCNEDLCIDLASEGGSGTFLTEWDGYSSSAGPCSQIVFLLNNTLVAETPDTCRGPGEYTATWVPDKDFPSAWACVGDLHNFGEPCESITEYGGIY